MEASAGTLNLALTKKQGQADAQLALQTDHPAGTSGNPEALPLIKPWTYPVHKTENFLS